jgi:sugar phosphate permease
MDFRLDKQTGETDTKEVKEEDKFKFSDIFKILTNKHYILVSLLCVFFYCCIISFKKFGTSILIPRFGIDLEIAKWMIAMIPFFTVIFTPLFGSLVDHKGKGTTWMILRFMRGASSTSVNMLCTRRFSFLRLCGNCSFGRWIFIGSGCNVAVHSKDYSGEKSWFCILFDLLDSEYGNVIGSNICRRHPKESI